MRRQFRRFEKTLISKHKPAAAPSAQLSGGKPGVLAVDGEPLSRIMVRLGLQRHGFHVFSAADGREAIDLYEEHRRDISVVLLDVELSGLDGPQTLDVLRGLNPEVPACFMTASLGDHEPDELMERGAACVIAKPLQLDHLASILWLMVNGAPTEFPSAGRTAGAYGDADPR